MDFIDCPFCKTKHPLLNDGGGYIFFCQKAGEKEGKEEGTWYLRSKDGSVTVKIMEDRTRLNVE